MRSKLGEVLLGLEGVSDLGTDDGLQAWVDGAHLRHQGEALKQSTALGEDVLATVPAITNQLTSEIQSLTQYCAVSP